jgi:hypothetical protein
LNKKSEKKKDKKESAANAPIRQPWIPRETGYTAITVVSVGMAVWTIWQTVAGGDTLWKGILWGLIFGASIWLVFFGMNYFHSLFNRTDHKKEK